MYIYIQYTYNLYDIKSKRTRNFKPSKHGIRFQVPGYHPAVSFVWTVPAFSSKDVARTYESQYSFGTKARPHELVLEDMLGLKSNTEPGFLGI
jgi:hypothetical protein